MDFEDRYFAEVYGGDYDRRNPRRKTKPLLQAVARFVERGRLLDVGCAYGAFLREAARSGRYELSGTDVSGHAVDVARRRLAEQGVDLRPGGLFESDFTPGSFDAVCMFDVIEHIEDLDAAFARVGSLLKPGGLFAMSVPVYDGPVGGLVQRLDRDPTHVHKLARSRWVEVCDARGFQVLFWLGLWRYFLAGRVYLYWQSLYGKELAPAVLLFARWKGR
jgi:SAM-dependent methyltransferase